MGKYKVINGQNLYDVALHLYGSIEGITDLLICNPELSLAATLHSGDELTYTDDLPIDADTVAYNRIHNIVPANGERRVYFKEPQGAMAVEILVPHDNTSAGFSAGGEGTVQVDWGDNSPLENIGLTDRLSRYAHFFDNTVSGSRRIRFYGDFRWRQIDITELHPSAVRLLRPVPAGEFTLKGCGAPVDFLPLLEGVYRIDLSGMRLHDLLPLIECRQAMEIDLRRIDTLRQSLDEMLIAFVREHYGRRNCRVLLSERPSGEYREPERDGGGNYAVTSGMEAVWLLTHEPAWNEGGPWEVVIGDESYKNEGYPCKSSSTCSPTR